MSQFQATQNKAAIKKIRSLLGNSFSDHASENLEKSKADHAFKIRGHHGQVCIRIYNEPKPNVHGGLLLSKGGQQYLAHTGNFSMKVQGFREYYLQNTKQKTVKFEWENKHYQAVLIAALDNDKKFYDGIEKFINDVLELKSVYVDDYGLKPTEHEAIDEINARFRNGKIAATTREQLIKSRCGQGKFRKDVLTLYGTCFFTGIQDPTILVAGHIKSWIESNNEERLDPLNGFALTPTYDRLFDQHLISFDDKGGLLVSSKLDKKLCKILNLKEGKVFLDGKEIATRKKYLDSHAKIFFRKQR